MFSIRTLALAILILFLSVTTGWATDRRGDRPVAPTLARLSFWVPPARMVEFESAYEAKVIPILKRHNLVPSSERGRATPDSIFSRLFEMKTPSEVEEKQKALQGDSAWTAVLQSLGATFGTPSWNNDFIQNNFTLYSAPAGPGKVVSGGPGKVVPAGRGTGHWRTFDATDGLANANVLSILQDRDGYLWFGTNGGGVSRYDGHGPSTGSGQSFTTFTTKDGLAGNIVTSILQDREGVLWFGGNSWVSRYDGKKFATLTTREGLARGFVRSIFQDRDGHLWFGSDDFGRGGGGASRYDGKSPSTGPSTSLRTSSGQGFTTFTTKDGLADNRVWSILQDREGVLWFGTSGGVSRYDPSALLRTGGKTPSTSSGQAFTTFTTRDGLANNAVLSIFQDREGHLWFGTYGGGVSRYDGHGFTTFTTKEGLAGNRVWPIIQDREGVLWFGTYEGGVSRYDGKTFTNFTVENGLAGNLVQSILQDREGYLWFGTDGGGVSRYDRHITTFTARDGLAGNGVWSILQDREGVLWFGTDGGGVSRYDGKTFTTFTTENGLAGNFAISRFQGQEGNFWFGAYDGGVSRYDGKTFTTFTTQDGLVSNRVLSILQDREGHLWFGTGWGISRYDGQTFTTFTTQDGLAGNSVHSILQDREGHLWFGGLGGVSRYDGKSFTTFTSKEGLASNRVRSIFQDREGNLWFGADGGVSRYDGRTFTTFTKEDGLASNDVGHIFQDREGVLWFRTSGGGVNRYDGQVFQTLTRQDGLASNSGGPILQDREGVLWFGTTSGVTRYRPSAPSPPPVFVDAVVADRRYEKVSELSVPSSVKLTAFEFHAMSFKTRPEAMVYRYRLKGYDRDWQNTHARRVEYQDLPRGNYTFEVVAVDRDLVYSKAPATVTLRVHLPYTLIGLLSALGIALALVAWQTARVVRRDRRLSAANEDLRREMTERQQAEQERARLDERLQHLRYLYRLREALGTARSPDEIFQKTGEALMEVLSPSASAGVLIEHDGRKWEFGETEGPHPGLASLAHPSPTSGRGEGVRAGSFRPSSFILSPLDEGQVRYERPLAWGGKQRGCLRLFCGVELSESQERALLDETAGQIASVLEARALEMQIVQSSRLVSMGQMAAGVAHELNQPLTAISNTAGSVCVRLAEKIGLSEEELKAMMQDVLGLVDRMSGTIDHLRVFSRDKSQEPGYPFSINEVIHSSLRLVEAQLKSHGIALHLDLGDSLPSISGHPHQMEQVFLNLLNNARDALDEKTSPSPSHEKDDRRPSLSQWERGRGLRPQREQQVEWGKGVGEVSRITNHESRGWEKRVWIRTRREGDGMVVEVEDNGPGMDEGVRARLFEPFFTTKPADRGTGLGLSICYAIVRDHGGQITCESRKGEGTTFRVRLPVASET